MAFTNEQLLTNLRDVEVLAEDVLSDKQEIVDLDRKRHRNREAIRAIDTACKSHWAGDDSKTWLAMGNSFFSLPAKKATELLKKDQVELDSGINVLRSNLKQKVNDLRDAEGKEELKGFGLRAVSADELAAVRQVIGPKPETVSHKKY